MTDPLIVQALMADAQRNAAEIRDVLTEIDCKGRHWAAEHIRDLRATLAKTYARLAISESAAIAAELDLHRRAEHAGRDGR